MQLDKIDFVVLQKNGKYKLVFIVDEEWDQTEAFSNKILEKMNNYASYFLDGQMVEDYPKCTQERIIVEVDYIGKMQEAHLPMFHALQNSFIEHRLDIVLKEI